MKITLKFDEVLEGYEVWSQCRSPLGKHAERKIGGRFRTVRGYEVGFGAKEALFMAETFGVYIPIVGDQWSSAWRWIRGKAMKDWWHKEIQWWRREAMFVCPEEFLSCLNPECFIQLFGRAPRVHWTRLVFDNGYSWEEFEVDAQRCLLGLETVPGGVQVIS